MADDLHQAGVQRLNVSLDSLKPETFSDITRGGDLGRVLAGLDAAERAGFPPPKINCVIMRGVNDAEILDFAELTRQRGNAVRFIEYMPALKEEGWQRYCITGDEILERIAAQLSAGSAGQRALCRSFPGFPHSRRPRQHRHHHRRLGALLQRVQPHPGHLHRPGQGLSLLGSRKPIWCRFCGRRTRIAWPRCCAASFPASRNGTASPARGTNTTISTCLRSEDSSMAKVEAVCISENKGERKKPVAAVELREKHGIVDDAHAGDWHRQVSLLAQESIDKMRGDGAGRERR